MFIEEIHQVSALDNPNQPLIGRKQLGQSVCDTLNVFKI